MSTSASVAKLRLSETLTSARRIDVPVTTGGYTRATPGVKAGRCASHGGPARQLFGVPRQVREQLFAARVLELHQPTDLDLADPLAREVEDLPDLLERDATLLGDIERAAVLELPDLEVG